MHRGGTPLTIYEHNAVWRDAVEESLNILDAFIITEFSLDENERAKLVDCLQHARTSALNDMPSQICYWLRAFIAIIEDDDRWDAEAVYKAVAHAALALAE